MKTGSEDRYIEKLDRWSSHSIIRNWLKELPQGTKVLDVGTAGGILGRHFFSSGLHLRGIEVVPEYAEAARPYYDDLVCTGIEDVAEEYIANQDVIVCADVIEHLVDPISVLSRLVNLQKLQTQFFISVPNIANLWIRLNLLFGKFDYSENGILDRTHLHFYTKKTFINLVNQSGLTLLEIKYTPVPLTRVSPFYSENRFGQFLHRVLASITQLLPTLLAYQIVVRAIISEIRVNK